MRIAFVTIEYPPQLIGGAGIYAGELCTRLGARGHDVVVFTPRSSDGELPAPSPGVRLCSIPVHPSIPQAPQFWLRLRRALAEEGRFDIVHLNSASYWPLSGRRLTPYPTIMTVHHTVAGVAAKNNASMLRRLTEVGSENGFFLPIIERSCIRMSDHLIAVSSFTLENIVQIYPDAREKITLISPGPGASLPSPSLSPQEVRSQFAIPDGKVILFVGRVNDPRKGLDTLIKAMPGISTAATLVVAGGGDQTAMRSLAEEHVIGKKVVFTGFIGDDALASLYALADICVVPSRLEGYGYTAVQPMLLGKPVLAASVGALPEIVPKAGLFPMGDEGELARKLDFLLSSPEDMARLRSLSLESANGLLTFDGMADRTEALYSELSQGVHRPVDV